MWSGKAKPEQSARFGTDRHHEPKVGLSPEDLGRMMNVKLPEKVETFIVTLHDAEVEKLRLFTTAQFLPMDEFIKAAQDGATGIYTIERQTINGKRFTYLVSFYGAAVTVQHEGQSLKEAFLDYLMGAFPDDLHPKDWRIAH